MSPTIDAAVGFWIAAYLAWWTIINSVINYRRTHDAEEIRKSLLILARRIAVRDSSASPATWTANLATVGLKFVQDHDLMATLERARMFAYGFLTGASGLLITSIALSQQGPQPGGACASAITWLNSTLIIFCVIATVCLIIVAILFDGPAAFWDMAKKPKS